MKAVWNQRQTVRQVSSSSSAAEDFFFPDREAENCISSDCSADMTEAEVG